MKHLLSTCKKFGHKLSAFLSAGLIIAYVAGVTLMYTEPLKAGTNMGPQVCTATNPSQATNLRYKQGF